MDVRACFESPRGRHGAGRLGALLAAVARGWPNATRPGRSRSTPDGRLGGPPNTTRRLDVLDEIKARRARVARAGSDSARAADRRGGRGTRRRRTGGPGRRVLLFAHIRRAAARCSGTGAQARAQAAGLKPALCKEGDLRATTAAPRSSAGWAAELVGGSCGATARTARTRAAAGPPRLPRDAARASRRRRAGACCSKLAGQVQHAPRSCSRRGKSPPAERRATPVGRGRVLRRAPHGVRAGRRRHAARGAEGRSSMRTSSSTRSPPATRPASRVSRSFGGGSAGPPSPHSPLPPLDPHDPPQARMLCDDDARRAAGAPGPAEPACARGPLRTSARSSACSTGAAAAAADAIRGLCVCVCVCVCRALSLAPTSRGGRAHANPPCHSRVWWRGRPLCSPDDQAV